MLRFSSLAISSIRSATMLLLHFNLSFGTDVEKEGSFHYQEQSNDSFSRIALTQL